MNKIFGALATALLLSGPSCKKIDELTEFDINYTTTQTVPASSVSVGGTVDFMTPGIATESSSKFSANGTSSDLVSEVKVSRFAVTNESGNLDFLNSFTVYINADGVGETQIASKTGIPDGVNTVNADVTNANVKAHLLKDTIRLRMRVTVDNLPTADQQLKIDKTMRVSGKKLSKK